MKPDTDDAITWLDADQRFGLRVEVQTASHTDQRQETRAVRLVVVLTIGEGQTERVETPMFTAATALEIAQLLTLAATTTDPKASAELLGRLHQDNMATRALLALPRSAPN